MKNQAGESKLGPMGPVQLPPPELDYGVMIAREKAAGEFLASLARSSPRLADIAPALDSDVKALAAFIVAVRDAFLVDPPSVNAAMDLLGAQQVRDELEARRKTLESELDRARAQGKPPQPLARTDADPKETPEYQIALLTNRLVHTEAIEAELDQAAEEAAERERAAESREEVREAGAELSRIRKLRAKAEAQARLLRSRIKVFKGETEDSSGDLTQGELDSIYEAAEKAKEESLRHRQALERAQGKADVSREEWQERYAKARPRAQAAPEAEAAPDELGHYENRLRKLGEL